VTGVAEVFGLALHRSPRNFPRSSSCSESNPAAGSSVPEATADESESEVSVDAQGGTGAAGCLAAFDLLARAAFLDPVFAWITG
jgi:hypothetical protein